MYRKLFVLASSALIILILVLYHEAFLAWVQNHDGDYVVGTMIIATFMSLFPVIPYPLVGGVIGAAFGPLTGAWIIWFGSTMASAIFFLLVRYGGFHEMGTKILLKYNVTKKSRSSLSEMPFCPLRS